MSQKKFKVSGVLHVTCELVVWAEDEEAALEGFHEYLQNSDRDNISMHVIDTEGFIAEELED